MTKASALRYATVIPHTDGALHMCDFPLLRTGIRVVQAVPASICSSVTNLPSRAVM